MKLVKTQQLTRSGANRNPILMACLLFCATTAWKPAQASDYWWGCADDYWQNISCWIPRGGSSTPTSTDNVYVDLGSSGYMTLRIDSATGNAYAYSLYAMSSTSSITIEQSGGNLATYSESILENSTFNQSGGTNTAERLFVTAGGYDGSSGGSYAFSGGSLTTMGTIIDYGGSFAHTGGTHTVEILHLGHSYNDGWDGGTYTLDGTGSLSALFEHIGPTSSFIQNNGTNTVSNRLAVGEASFGVAGSANGSYTLNGGNLSTFDEYIGDVGTGSFIQSGGTHTVSNNLVLGNYGGNGSYTLNGGSLSVSSEDIGFGGTSSFIQNGGTHTVTNYLVLGNNGGNGSYTLNGGSLSVSLEYIGGAGNFTQTGGSHTIARLMVGSNPEPATGSSRYTLGGTGSLSAFNEDIGTGNFIQNNGTNTVSNRLTVGYGSFGISGSANGNYTLNGGSLSTFDEYIGFYSGTGNFIQNGGSHTVSNNLVLGDSGGSTGSFILNGGTHTISNDLVLGNNGGNGSYTLNGGSLSAINEYVGHFGNHSTGTFTQTGGTNVTSTMVLAAPSIYGDQISGTYNLTGGKLDAGDIFVTNGGVFNFTGGTLTVRNFIGNLLNNGGTLAPGHSPGVTTITGNYTQSALGSYAVEIGGLLAGSEHDLLSISGSASLAGSLNVSLIDLGSGLFTPQVGDTFDILTAETITGTFDILSFANLINPNLSWHIDYLTDAIGTTDVVRLSVVQAVPLPAAVWLLGSGLLGLIGFGRRRKQ